MTQGPIEKGIGPPDQKALSVSDLLRWLQRLVAVFPQTKTYEVTLDPVSVAALTVADQVFTVTGLHTKDQVSVNPPSMPAGLLMCQTKVTANDQLTIRFYNTTAGAINPSAGTYKITATRL